MNNHKINNYFVLLLIFLCAVAFFTTSHAKQPIDDRNSSLGQVQRQDLDQLESSVYSDINLLKKNSLELNDRLNQIEYHKSPLTKWDKWLFIGGIVLLILILLWFANKTSNQLISYLDQNDRNRIIEFTLKQTFGVPQGTVRGILAFVVAFIFMGAAFLYYPGEIPDSVKMLASVVFGFYFAKEKDQFDLLSPKKSQKDQLTKEAKLKIEIAREAGAEQFANDMFQHAQTLFDNANHTEKEENAINLLQNVIKIAEEAKQKTILESQNHQQKMAEDDKKISEQLLASLKQNIADLSAFNINPIEIQKRFEQAQALLDNNNYKASRTILDQAKAMANVLLKDYIDAKSIFENGVPNDLKQQFMVAKNNLDASPALSQYVNSEGLIGGIFCILSQLSEKKPLQNWIHFFQKRVKNDPFTPDDMNAIFKLMTPTNQQKRLKNAIDIAANSLSDLLPNDLISKLKQANVSVIESLITDPNASPTELLSDPNLDTITLHYLDQFINKCRKNIVDTQIGDIVKNALGDHVAFDQYKKAIKSSQLDEDGYGTLNSLDTIIQTGLSFLSFPNAQPHYLSKLSKML